MIIESGDFIRVFFINLNIITEPESGEKQSKEISGRTGAA